MKAENRNALTESIERYGKTEYARGYRVGREAGRQAAEIELDFQPPAWAVFFTGAVCGVIASELVDLLVRMWL